MKKHLIDIANLDDSYIDRDEIRKIAKKYGAESWFSRPAELSKDDSPKIPVIKHALEESEKNFNCKFDHIIDLDITAPLRNVEDIKKAYKIFLKDGLDNLITGTKLDITIPDGKVVSLNIPKGTQPNTVFSIAQRGLPNRRGGKQGNILVKIIGETPRHLDNDDLNAIEQIKSKI